MLSLKSINSGALKGMLFALLIGIFVILPNFVFASCDLPYLFPFDIAGHTMNSGTIMSDGRGFYSEMMPEDFSPAIDGGAYYGYFQDRAIGWISYDGVSVVDADSISGMGSAPIDFENWCTTSVVVDEPRSGTIQPNWFGAPDDSVPYLASDYFLNVEAPKLDDNYHASVQPSANFKVRLRYLVPDDKFDSTHFSADACPLVDSPMGDCTTIASGTIALIRDALADDENNLHQIYFETSVVLNEWTHLRIWLVDDANNGKVIYGTPFSLLGVADVSLPSANSATLKNGAVQDLGFWGNLMRDVMIVLFKPNEALLAVTIQESWAEFKVQFADFFTLFDAVRPRSAGIDSVLFEGEFDYNGSTANIIFDPLHTIPIPPLIPQIASFIMFIGLGWWLIRKLSDLFPQ